MGGAISLHHLAIVLRPGILISDLNSNRGASSFALKYSRQDLAEIELIPGCNQVALPGSPSVEFNLDFGCANLDQRGTTIDDDPDYTSVRLAKGGNPK
jgi:hypothetical protein